MTKMNLLDICRSFDGGVVALADAADVATHRIYKFAAGRHSKCPVELIGRIARAFGDDAILLTGEKVSPSLLLQKWQVIQKEGDSRYDPR
jgi:hypothetical protein